MTEHDDKVDEIKAKVQSTARRAQKKATRASNAAKRELDLGGFSPALVGFLRGLLGAAAIGALNFIIAQLGGIEGEGAGAVGLVSTVLVGALRTVEGLIDGKLLGAPRSARPLGGGRPAK